MTEAEWLACEDPTPMVKCVVAHSSGVRKLRLLTVAAARMVWESVTDAEMRRAIETSELYADGRETAGAVAACRETVYRYALNHFNGTANPQEREWLQDAPKRAVYHLVMATTYEDKRVSRLDHGSVWEDGAAKLGPPLAPVIRDIFGNPFRPVAFSPEWRTDTAVALARQMYDARDFGAMPILADALQDAGCDNDDILSHCRSEGAHVRGCWVVDLLLGKE